MKSFINFTAFNHLFPLKDRTHFGNCGKTNTVIWLILASLLTRILTLIEYCGISFVRPNLAVCVVIGLKIVDTKETI